MPASVWLLEMCYLNFMVPLKPFSTYWELNPHARLKPSQHPVWDLNSLWLGLSQFSSVAQSCPTLCDSMDCSMPGLPVHHQVPQPTQTDVIRASDAIQPSHPLSSPSPPALNLCQHQGLFQWVGSSHQSQLFTWPKFWSFHISPSNEYSGLISFKIDWFDLPDVQGSLKSLL